MALKHIKIREYIAKMLADDSKNTGEILRAINQHFRHGTNSQILGNILSKDPRFMKIGWEYVAGVLGGEYRLSLIHI